MSVVVVSPSALVPEGEWGRYQPVVYFQDGEPPVMPVVHGCTHCRDTKGRVWRIRRRLNRRSVPLDGYGDPPQRLPFHRVESLGRLTPAGKEQA